LKLEFGNSVSGVMTGKLTLLIYLCMMAQQFYAWSQDAAVTLAEKALQGVGTVQDANVCAAALHLMSQLLNWDFRGTLVRGPNGILVGARNRGNAFTTSMGRESVKRPGEHASMVQVL
jgi:hypothetical protein